MNRWAESYIGIGSNLDDPCAQVKQAITALSTFEDIKLATYSSLYQSDPMGPADQNDYINAVVKIETVLSPIALLDRLQSIEKDQGRIRKSERWGPRTIDLDLLLYDNQTIDNPRLTVPHYGLEERSFVIFPLYEIEPDLILPNQTKLVDIVDQTQQTGIRILRETIVD